MNIAHIAVPVPLATLYDYLIPDNLQQKIAPGTRVNISFGMRNAIGIVVAISDSSPLDRSLLKTIDAVLDTSPLFPPKLWQLLTWASNYYHYPLGEVLFHALPVSLRQGKPAAMEQKKTWQLTTEGINTNVATVTLPAKQKALLQLLQNNTAEDTLKTSLFSQLIYKKLADRGLIKQDIIPLPPEMNQASYYANQSTLKLNQEQLSAVKAIVGALKAFDVWLLDGVTGSGKTEIYLSVLAEVLQSGKQALILIPEISLTPQTSEQFKARFAAPIDMLHSGLTNKQRLAVYLRAKYGATAIVIGTRSALFTPFKQLGLIIIDEEHDGSYKQQQGFRYHARDLAIVRAKLENIPIILGSATPSLASLHNAKSGKYKYLKLTKRAGNATFARQHIIDIKGLHLTAGLSKPLIMRMRSHLDKNQQILLFLNRRGYAPLLICHDCGWIIHCPHCDKPYTYHQKQHILRCHHCDASRHIPMQCNDCGSTYLKALGVGTEQIEQQLKIDFPTITISRIDRDSTAKKGNLENYLQQINQNKAHILIGTQMLAKGHHFPNVTLVGIIDVDGALFSNDFQATERFAQIYTQVAGRAGRENKCGEVIMQTYHPTHPLLNLLLSQNYHAFACKTLQERQATLLPPYSYHVVLHAADKNNLHALAFLQRAYNWIKQQSPDPALWLCKPMPAILPKKAGYYRWQLLLQHNNRQYLQQLTHALNKQIITWSDTKQVRWIIDVDPIDV